MTEETAKRIAAALEEQLAEQTELLAIMRRWQAFMTSGNGEHPFACPVCGGRRVVASPMPMASSDAIGTVPCPACNGEGVLWRPAALVI